MNESVHNSLSVDEPVVTVGIPVYNGAEKIGDCLRSMISQSLQNIEILVSDNASTDDTIRIVKEFAKTDKRIKLVENAVNRGTLANFNRLRGLASGRFMALIADDVRFEPKFLESCVAVLESRSDVVGCYSSIRLRDPEGEVLTEHRDPFNLDIPDPLERCTILSDKISSGNMFYGVFRSDAVRSAFNHYRIRNRQYMFDRYMLCPMAIKGRIVQLEEFLMNRLLDDWQASRSGSDRETLYNQTHLRYERVVAIPPGRANLPTLESIYNVCEEFFFCDLEWAEVKALTDTLFDSLICRYRNQINMDFESAEGIVTACTGENGLNAASILQLSELAQCLPKAAVAEVKSEFALKVQSRAAVLNSKIADTLRFHFEAIAPKEAEKVEPTPGILGGLVDKIKSLFGRNS